MTDAYFWHGIHRWIMSRLNHGSGKNFLYRFDAVTDLNFIKHLFSKTSEYDGAAHGDEIAYLWKFDSSSFRDMKQPSLESNEFKAIKKMINCWTSFAKNGIPDCDSDVVWEHLASSTLPFNCMNITAQEWTQILFPENDRMVVWNSVYEDGKIEMF
jgi:cholinesterase